MEGFSKSQKPRDKVQQFQASQVRVQQRPVALGSELTGWPSALLWLLFPSGWLCGLFLQPGFCRCTQACAALPGAVTPPARVGPVPVRPRNGCRG